MKRIKPWLPGKITLKDDEVAVFPPGSKYITAEDFEKLPKEAQELIEQLGCEFTHDVLMVPQKKSR